MARKRMFDLEIINQESFLDLPSEAIALYFLLGMNADDEGFIAPKRVMRLYNIASDTLKILIIKKYVIPFDSGVVVITDWKRNNYLDTNRAVDTIYQEEKSQVYYNDETKKYELFNNGLTNVKQMLNQYSIEEYSIEENSIENNIIIPKANDCVKTNLEIEFDNVWKNYPRKQGKTNALKYYIRARKKGVTREEIERGLNNYLQYIKLERIKSEFIKQGSTWFNQECWNDDYKTDKKPSIRDLDLDINGLEW